MSESLLTKRPDQSARIALYDSATGRTYTRSELRRAVAAFCPEMQATGHALAFCFCANAAGPVLAYLACFERRIPVLLLDAALHGDLKRALLALYEPEFVIFPCTGPNAPLKLLGPGYSVIEGGLATVARKKPGSGSALHRELALLLSTSGTTGSPKLVRISRRSVLHNAAAIAAALSISPADRAITSLPLQYSYGLSVLNSHLLAGASVVLTTAGVTSAGFWKTFRDSECTSLAGIPYTYEALAQLGLERLGLPSLSCLTQAGGRLREELILHFHDEMRRRGGRFYVMYGQTEATARISVLDPEYLPAKAGSIGKPIPGGRLHIEAETGIVTEPQAQGELVYTGPNVMMGYACNREELALDDENAGQLRTGDAGYFDRDGFFYLTGRLNRFGKVSGFRLNLDEVEAMFVSLGRTAVVEDAERLFVYCENPDGASFRRCAREISEKLRIHPRAFVFQPVPQIPLTAKGRPDYAALARSAALTRPRDR